MTPHNCYAAMRGSHSRILGWLRSKIPRAREVYRSNGFPGVVEGAIDSLRREEFIWYVQRWHEDFRWKRLRRTNMNTEPVVAVRWGRLHVDPSDPGISRELLLYGIHEPIASSLLRETISEGMVVVDVGSNIGYYLTLAAARVGERGTVVGIEPAPRNIRLLRKNIQLNGLTNVCVVEGAVGDRDGDGTLFFSDLSNWHSTLPSRQAQRGHVSVTMHKLDTLVERLNLSRVDLIRMDIEGAEVEALPGMLRTLQTWRPKLVIEMHPPLVGKERIREVLRTLENLGYVPQHIVPRGLDYVRPVPWFYHLDWVRLISNLQTWFTGFYVTDETLRGNLSPLGLRLLIRRYPLRPRWYPGKRQEHRT